MKTMIEVTENLGVIDFILPKDEIVKVRGNTYLHCHFEKLEIVGNYTPISYNGDK